MIADRVDLQRTEHRVARMLAETGQPMQAYDAVLEAIGTSLGWELGAAWEVDPDDGRLRCVCTWHAEEGALEFAALTERLVLAPGEGLPGRVVVSGEPTWVTDANVDPNFPRADAARRVGLHAAFAFPCAARAGSSG